MRRHITLIIVSIILICFPQKSNAQDNSDGTAIVTSLAVTSISIWASIEKNKDRLELRAANHIMLTYPEFNEFRVEILGSGFGGKEWRDNGGIKMIPFGLTELKDAVPTTNRKLLFLIISPNWVNSSGIDLSKCTWEIWNVGKWNNLMCSYTSLNSLYTNEIIDMQIPVYEYASAETYNQTDKDNRLYVVGNDNSTYYYYIKSEFKFKKKEQKKNSSFIHLKDLKYDELGWYYRASLIFPFFNLKNTDYIVQIHNETINVFANGSSFGIFVKDFEDSMLISRRLINKIHSFINFQD
jgi:hypothetical protein